jgi:hypothetical protein
MSIGPSRGRLYLLVKSLCAKIYVSIFCELAVIVGVTCFVGLASAAEITMDKWVTLEGQIEPGDYEKLRDFLVAERGYRPYHSAHCSEIYEDGCPEQIYLASPGGDVAEAMKIGRLIRTLGWTTKAPSSTARQYEIKDYQIQFPDTNFMCASACFFIFVGGVYREELFTYPTLGIHRPYLSTEHLKELSGGQALAAATLTRATVEKYLKEMDVPTKYVDKMFSVPKDKILWISDDDVDVDFKGFVPSLRDWADAKCNTLTDVEKAVWESIKNKSPKYMTQLESSISDMLVKKKQEQPFCEDKARFELRRDAWERCRRETLQNIANMCAARKNSLSSELATAVSLAKPNQQSAAVALRLAQTAALCRDYELRENAIQVLATRGDAKAQRILGNLYYFGGQTIGKDHDLEQEEKRVKDQVEGMAWYGRAGSQGDLFAQKFYHDLADKKSNPNHVWTDQEYREVGKWISQNCPALC